MPRRKIEDLRADRHLRKSALGRLFRQSEARTSWTEQLRALLPNDEASHYSVANLRGDRLTVHASNASWASRLKFQIPELLPRLRQLADFARVEDIRVRATRQDAPGGLEREEPGGVRPAPSPPPQEPLLELAEHTDYGELKEAILRLARHAEARPGSHDSD